jgi:DNA repair exonuclease SbcCD nuclease subunit
MRLLACADLHIRIHKDWPLDWQFQRYTKFFSALVERARRDCDAVVLAGDLLDNRNLNRFDLYLLFQLLTALNAAELPTVIVSGNHETLSEQGNSDSVLSWVLPLSSMKQLVYAKEPSQVDVAGVTLDLVNHHNLRTFEGFDTPGNILVTHVRCTVNEHIQEETDIAKLCSPYQLTIAGDIHMPLTVEEHRLHYTNTPLDKQFHQGERENGWLIVESDGSGFNLTRETTDFPELRDTVELNADNAQELAHDLRDSPHLTRINVRDTQPKLQQLRSGADKWAGNILLNPIPELPGKRYQDPDDPEANTLEGFSFGIGSDLEEPLLDYVVEACPKHPAARVQQVFQERIR